MTAPHISEQAFAMLRGTFFTWAPLLHTAFRARLQVPLPLTVGMLWLSLLLASPASSWAEVRVVRGTGQHRMSDRETTADAVRLATEQAKKNALEQIASYLESVTVVRNLDVTQDEIRSYSAGIVSVKDQQVKTELDGDVVTIRVELTAQADTEEVAHAIAALKHNQDAREQLLALRRDVEQLQRDLDSTNRALAAATSPEQGRRFTAKRHELLNRTDSDAMVAQAWTDWLLVASMMQPYPSAGLAQVQGWLAFASRLSPDNPHLTIAQNAVATKIPPAPPQPRRPPIPHTVPFLPGYSVAPQQADQSSANQDNSQQPSSMYQLNRVSPNSPAPASSAESTTTIIHEPNSPESSLSSTRGAMLPTYRQAPPSTDHSTTGTLLTHQGDPSPEGPRRVRPAIKYQVPQKRATAPPSSSSPPPVQDTVPDKGTMSGGK